MEEDQLRRDRDLDRRDFLRRAALTAGAAAPVILTLSATPAYAACHTPVGGCTNSVNSCGGGPNCVCCRPIGSLGNGTCFTGIGPGNANCPSGMQKI